MIPERGIEPPTNCSADSRSFQLSYFGFRQRCASPEVPAPFEGQNAPHLSARSPAGYMTRYFAVPDPPTGSCISWDPPSLAGSDYYPLRIHNRFASAAFGCHVTARRVITVGHSRTYAHHSPVGDPPMTGEPLKELVCMGYPFQGGGCHAPFAGSPRFICHASCLMVASPGLISGG